MGLSKYLVGVTRFEIATTGFSESMYANEDNQRQVKVSDEVGSTITAKGDITLRTDNNIGIRGSNVIADTGAVALSAGQDVTIENSLSSESVDAKSGYKVSGQLSRSSIKESGAKSREVANFSNIEGNTVAIQAGRDIGLTGTNALSDSGTQLSAGRDFSILAAKNTLTENSSSQEKKKGIFGSEGSTGFTIGKQQTDNSNTKTETKYVGSNVGAIDGNVIIDAGRNYQQTGSNLIAGTGTDTQDALNNSNRGNVVVRAQDIDIDNNMNVTTNQSEQKFKQTGLTVSVSNSLVDNVNTIKNLEEATGNTRSTRMKGMAAIPKDRALAKQTSDALQGVLSLGNTRIQATISTRKSQSNSSSYNDQNQGSSITTNNLALIATGAGTDSNININGSTLDVTNNALFQADNDFNVNDVTQNSNIRSTNSSSSAAIGGYASTGNSGQASAGITANVSRGKGYANSTLNIKGTTTFDIDNDVTFDSATLNTDKLTGRVGGNFTGISRQDTATYDSNQKNVDFTGDFDILGGGAGSSLSVNGGITDVNADYKAVNEQAGYFTQFSDLIVEGKGRFDGAGFTTVSAEDNQTVFKQGIETSDIINTTSYEGDAISVGLSLGKTEGKPQATMNGLGYGTDSDGDSDSSITKGGVSGYSDPDGNLATDNREAISGKLESVFDVRRVTE